MTNIRAWIQHHPSRADLLPKLIASTGLPTEVEIDNGPPPANPWRGYKRCLSRVAMSSAGFGVILQDDAILCKNFGPAMLEIAKTNDDAPVVLFLGALPIPTAHRARHAAKRGAHYVDLCSRDFCPVVGMLWPKHKAIEFLHWAAHNPRLPNARSDDAVIGYWAREMKQRVRVTVPSLVQHPDTESIVHPKRAKAGKDRGRVAMHFCDGDPLDYDWS